MAEENPFKDLPKFDEKAEKAAPPKWTPGDRVRIVKAERIHKDFQDRTATVVSPEDYEGVAFGGVCLRLDEPVAQTVTHRPRDEEGKYLRDDEGKIVKTEEEVQTSFIQVHEKDIVKAEG